MADGKLDLSKLSEIEDEEKLHKMVVPNIKFSDLFLNKLISSLCFKDY